MTQSNFLQRLSAPDILNFRALYCQAEQQALEYAEADPFPHIMIEDFLPATLVRSLLDEFPGPGAELKWRQLDSVSPEGEQMQYNKLGMPHAELLGETTRELLLELNSGSFLRYLSKLTNIPNLIADPTLQGGGLHQVLSGGVLGVHADFTGHRRYHLNRRLNVLIYLNEDWPESYGGELELWSQDMQRCVRRIRPLAGRCVVFSTTDSSYHGHPQPLRCPQNITRKSIALYYYSNGRPEHEIRSTHGTAWQVTANTERPSAE